MKTFIILSATVFLLSAFQVSTTSARTWYILPDGSGDAPTIQAGVDSASTGDIVEVACGTYSDCTHWATGPEGNLHLTSIIMKSGITLRSATGEPDCVIIDAMSSGRPIFCMDVDNTARIEGFTFTNGRPVGAGQFAYAGAGMFCYSSSPVIKSCNFRDNVAFHGGLQFASGGGAYCRNSSPEFIQCHFIDNSTKSSGGGVESRHGSVIFDQCIFAGNIVTEGFGGGVSLDVCPASFFNCTIYGNSAADGEGAGVTVVGGSSGLHLMQNTLVAFNLGDAIDLHSANFVFECCDIYGNEGEDWGINFGWTYLNGNFSADPCFCDPEGRDFHLCADSWCLPGNHPWGCDDLVGALGAGCGDCECGGPVPIESSTWGGVKALYR